MRIHPGKYTCLALILSAALAVAGEKTAPPALSRAELAGKLKQALLSKALGKTKPAVVVLDLATGKEVLAVRAVDPLIPASNMKLLTTAAALETLGKDCVFKTKVYATGPIGGGELRGDLVVIGSGDPNISGRLHNGDPCAVFKSWAASLKEMGVTRISGDVIGDDSLFDRAYTHTSWPANQLHKWYCAPSGALVLNDSCLDVTVGPGRTAGAPAVFRLSPPTAYLPVRNTCTTTAKRKEHSFGVTRAPGSRTAKIYGKYLAGAAPQTVNLTVDDPGIFFVTVLSEVLAGQGIRVAGVPRLIRKNEKPAHNILVAEHTSTLAATLAVMNKRSQNLYAEQVLKLLGAKAEGKGSFKSGADAVEKYLKKIGIPEKEFSIADGSGMSRTNRVSARAITGVLGRMFNSKKFCHTYWASLAIAGMDGTLENRFKKQPKAKGRIAAKSGYISGVCTLSGYVVTPGGRYFAFSVLANDVKGSVKAVKDMQEDICNILLENGDRLEK